MGNHAYEKNGGSYTPLSLCQEFYQNGSISPGKETFDIDAHIEKGIGKQSEDCLFIQIRVVLMKCNCLWKSKKADGNDYYLTLVTTKMGSMGNVYFCSALVLIFQEHRVLISVLNKNVTTLSSCGLWPTFSSVYCLFFLTECIEIYPMQTPTETRLDGTRLNFTLHFKRYSLYSS